jgi:lauroyl/myristoyl acyltransferase
MSITALKKPPKTSGSGSSTPLLVGEDLAIVVGLPVMAAIAWAAPERAWPAITRALAPIYSYMPSGPKRALEARIAGYLGARRAGATPAAVVAETGRVKIESVLHYMRQYRPGGWRPRLAVSGREHLDAGLAQGRGVILWVGHFVHHALITKMAFHQAGVAVSHLSHPRHGLSASRLGMRFINPIMNAIEERFVERRVVLALDDTSAAMAELRRTVERNGVVSITVRDTGRRPVVAPFLDGTIEFAAGAANLAYTSGAALLPVFTLADGDGGFRVAIEPPIEVAREAERGEAFERVARQYAGVLESYVVEHPEQWFGWSHL